MSLVAVRFDNSWFMIARSSVPSSEPSAKSLILRYTCAQFLRTVFHHIESHWKVSNIAGVLMHFLKTARASQSSNFTNAYNPCVILMILNDDTRSIFENCVFHYTCDKFGSTSLSESILTVTNRCQKFGIFE